MQYNTTGYQIRPILSTNELINIKTEMKDTLSPSF